jgi:hypothetical protein
MTQQGGDPLKTPIKREATHTLFMARPIPNTRRGLTHAFRRGVAP